MVVTHTHHNARVTNSSSKPDRHPPYLNAQEHTTTRVCPAGPESGDVCWKIARRRVLCVLCTVCVCALLSHVMLVRSKRERERGGFLCCHAFTLCCGICSPIQSYAATLFLPHDFLRVCGCVVVFVGGCFMYRFSNGHKLTHSITQTHMRTSKVHSRRGCYSTAFGIVSCDDILPRRPGCLWPHSGPECFPEPRGLFIYQIQCVCS